MPFQRLYRLYFIIYFVFFFGFIIFNYMHQRLLYQYAPIFFSHNRDLLELLIISTNFPNYLIQHPQLFWYLDFVLLALSIAIVINYIVFKKNTILLSICFTAYLFFYFLLQNIFIQIHLESFVAYLLLSLLFFISTEAKFYKLITVVRWVFLYVFVSAGLWKVIRGSMFYPLHMKNLLIMQHATYLSNGCDTVLCDSYRWLIEHWIFSQWIYILAVLLELSFIIGFFTKKYDLLLLFLAISFFLADHLLMLIPYWQIMLSGITLIPFLYSEKWRNGANNLV